jgi:hypothetical protein
LCQAGELPALSQCQCYANSEISGYLGSMATQTSIEKQNEVAAAVEDVVRELAPDVVRIRHDFAPDWDGDPAIFFRVILSDKASKLRGLHKVTARVDAAIREKLNSLGVELFPYIHFRSKSEQAKMKEKSWQ